MSDMQTAELLRQLRFNCGQLRRLSRLAEQNKIAHRNDIIRAIKRANLKEAQLPAECIIKRQTEILICQRMSSKIDALYSKILSTSSIVEVPENILFLVKALDKTISSMDPQTICAAMEQFEQQFADLNVQTSVDDDAVGSAITFSISVSQVESIIQGIAEQNGLVHELAQAKSCPIGQVVASAATSGRSLADALPCRRSDNETFTVDASHQ